jgi:hypothetical protein
VHDTITVLVAPAARKAAQRNTPSSEVHLARGLHAPSGGVRLARWLNAPSDEVCLARGLQAPSGEVRLARGLNTPRARSASLEGPPRARRSRSCSRVRAFNALTPQDARHDPDAPGNHAPVLFHRLPGEGHPRHCVTLCGEAGVSCLLLMYG